MKLTRTKNRSRATARRSAPAEPRRAAPSSSSDRSVGAQLPHDVRTTDVLACCGMVDGALLALDRGTRACLDHCDLSEDDATFIGVALDGCRRLVRGLGSVVEEAARADSAERRAAVYDLEERGDSLFQRACEVTGMLHAVRTQVLHVEGLDEESRTALVGALDLARAAVDDKLLPAVEEFGRGACQAKSPAGVAAHP